MFIYPRPKSIIADSPLILHFIKATNYLILYFVLIFKVIKSLRDYQILSMNIILIIEFYQFDLFFLIYKIVTEQLIVRCYHIFLKEVMQVTKKDFLISSLIFLILLLIILLFVVLI